MLFIRIPGEDHDLTEVTNIVSNLMFLRCGLYIFLAFDFMQDTTSIVMIIWTAFFHRHVCVTRAYPLVYKNKLAFLDPFLYRLNLLTTYTIF